MWRCVREHPVPVPLQVDIRLILVEVPHIGLMFEGTQEEFMELLTGNGSVCHSDSAHDKTKTKTSPTNAVTFA